METNGSSKGNAKHSFWEDHIKQWKKSNLTKIEYCKSHNLSKDRFYYWKKKFESLINPKKVAESQTSNKLLPVIVAPEDSQLEQRSLSDLKLVVNGRFTVQINSSFDNTTLSRLIVLLETL